MIAVDRWSGDDHQSTAIMSAPRLAVGQPGVACARSMRTPRTLSWAARCSWIMTASWSPASASLYVASDRLSAAAASTFCPTMITERRTNWRNVWEIHDTRVTALWDAIADGSLTRARAVKA